MSVEIDLLRRGSFSMGLRVSGTFEVRDGKIALWHDYFDRRRTAR